MPDLTELRRLAEALIDDELGGHWSATYGPRELPRIWADDQGVTAEPIFVAKRVEDTEEAEFVAAANPANVLELLDAAEALERVKALHRPVEVEPSESICASCSTRRGAGQDVRYFPYTDWPCPTVRAIEGTDHA